ncbi:glycosyltransferase family 2 protein [Rufibacter glacialis]|uniref:Glycosyltransferase family 2 protein n=1 Tax=Rufibacter glacialis TaxID=1259555 RepID=A0A5M8QNI3_9BACT|nr:glycosyltransferase family 2 protein [Rufibacter glacialis]KAA6437767.1 glycosyltransferase family 2 protein [Rufibacter glacialis]GGK56450.1 glycosyl transferase [Rufibacter glacialis]
MAPTYSLVIPIYNEEEILYALYDRLNRLMARLDGPVELIFVDDGSKDKSLKIIRELHQADSRIAYISLARNFGHQIAVTAGLHYAKGQAVVILDADLQDPPEVIPNLIARWKEGFQVVYAKRTIRHKEVLFKRVGAYLYYRILQRLSDITIPTDTGDFCLLDRKVVEVLNAMPERNRYIRGLRTWVGFRQVAVPFERDPRFAGERKYTLRKLIGLGLNGIFSFSRAPLKISTYLGFLSATVALAMAILILYWRLFQPDSQFTGFATILIAVFFLGAVQLISVGILGEYIGRIYEEVKGRPLFTCKELEGFDHLARVPGAPDRQTQQDIVFQYSPTVPSEG